MNIVSKATLLGLSLILVSGASADTNEMVKQIKSWGTDLERRLEIAQNSNAKLQKQLEKTSARLQAAETDRDTLKGELATSQRALKAAEKEAASANRRADKADREMARADERSKSDAAKMMSESKSTEAAIPVAKPTKAPLAAPAVAKPHSDAVTVVEVPATINELAPSVTPVAPAKAAEAPADDQPIIVDGVLIPAAPAMAVKELPTATEKLLKKTVAPMVKEAEEVEESVEDMMTTDDDTE